MDQLIQEKNFAAYCRMLKHFKDNILILIAVKDTPGFCLRADEQKAVK